MARPYKCPNCDGSGRRFYPASSGTAGEDCHSCHGTGIVWDYTDAWVNSWPRHDDWPGYYTAPRIGGGGTWY